MVGASLVAAAVALPSVGLPSVGLDLTTTAERAAATPQRPATRPVSASELVCPGPETIGVRGSSAPRTSAPSWLTAASPPAGLLGADAGGTLTAALLPATKDAATKDAVLAPGSSGVRHQQGRLSLPAAVAIRGTDALAPGLTGEQTTVVTAGDLRGLTSATCRTPAVDSWLVGGGGDEGRRGRLVLANPAPTPVDVRVDVLSGTGPVHASAGSAVAVPARSRLVLLLDALAPGVRSPVVRVRATGGAVAATLHDSLLTGTTPMGADDVTPAMAPARRVLVPGLTISGRALLRLAAPGAVDAVAQVRLLGRSGAVDPPGGPAVRVPAGGTLDVDLAGLPAGTYGVEVRADVPVVAGAMVERTNGDAGPADFAWLSSAAPLRAITGVAAVRTQNRWSTTIELTAPGEAAAVDLTTVNADGGQQTQTLRVPAGSSTLTVLPETDGAWLRPVSRSAEVVAARTTTYLNRSGDDHGRLITASSLGDLATTTVEPVVRPAG